MKQNKIAVIGAGTMGAETAYSLALRNYKVILKDISTQQLDRAQKHIEDAHKMLIFTNRIDKNITLDKILSNIKLTTLYEHFKDLDIIIENIDENFELKKSLYKELSTFHHQDLIYAINTSCIPITKIASELPEPKNVIGMHFMNPVHMKELVEIVKGYHTSDATIEKALEIVKNLEKQAILVNDYPGFVANRLSHLFMNEAAFLIQDNIAAPKDVDVIFKKGYGHKMGPLETADLIGIDTVVNSLSVLFNEYQDTKFRCCPLLKKMVGAGLLGKKSGQGFYKY